MTTPDRTTGIAAHGNAYNIFVLVLTIFSLVVMALLVLPIPQPVRDLLETYDAAICVLFLGDFAYNLSRSAPKRSYFIYARGWLDLLGSIPALGFFQYTALLRLARLSRLARITRLLRGNNRRELVRDVVQNRGQYATFITILAASIVLGVASVLVLLFETADPDGNIRTGGDALWWGIVTITTVGYGDRYPVTTLGRITGFVVMLAGVGIIGALASILASVLVSSPSEATGDDASTDGASRLPREPAGDVTRGTATADDPILARLDVLTAEVAQLRSELGAGRQRS